MKLKFNPFIDNRIAYFPQKYASFGIIFYLISLIVCNVLFSANALTLPLLFIGVVSIILFFLGSNSMGRQMSRLREKAFINRVILVAFVLRLGYAIFAYFFNEASYGTYFESSDGDITFYVPQAMDMIHKYGINLGAIIQEWTNEGIQMADMGYMLYLCVIFFISGGSDAPVVENPDLYGQYYIWLPLFLKAIWGAWTCILMYQLARRHFGENVGRMTALFCMLNPNMIWWCGSMMKETEMIFLSCLFAERMDRTISGINIRPTFIAGTTIIGLTMFSFRAALFMTAVAATVLAMVMTSSKSLTTGKKVLAGIMISVAMLVAVGDNIRQEFIGLTEKAQDREHVQTNMDWRTTREHGNQFAKYATATVFAPLIFTLPFPTMVYTHQGQEMLMMVNGGNYIKNVFSFFVIFALFQLLLSGQWRHHVFPIAYMIGYIAALVLSEFAQSGRFHMPAIPFLMMFAAYGLTMVTSQKHKQWFTYALVAEIGFCIFWSWFKLKGQGLI